MAPSVYLRQGGGRCAYEALIRSVWHQDQEWALYIVHRESRCEPGVTSRDGAAGLFQIESNSWHDPGGCPWSSRYIPSCNVRAAYALYLARGRQPWRL